VVTLAPELPADAVDVLVHACRGERCGPYQDGVFLQRRVWLDRVVLVGVSLVAATGAQAA
jgi:hypothetical protein